MLHCHTGEKSSHSLFLGDESVEILVEPFHCCVIQNFIKDDEFLDQLKSDVLSLNFHEKSNDLYKFQQACEQLCSLC